jgi:cell division cycle 2-like protein
MSGQSELEQLSKMVRLLGPPNVADWPEFASLEHAQNYTFNTRNAAQGSRLRELFPTHSFSASSNALSEQGFNLLQGLLTYNPAKRLTAAEALAHPYFSEAPLPQSSVLMPTFPASNVTAAPADGLGHRGPNSGDLKRKREQEAMGFFL